jgi:phosphate transport system substrate-binding protein
MSHKFGSPWSWRGLVAWGLGIALALASTARADPVVRISGTGSGVGGMQLLADAFMQAHPGTRVEVLPALGSGGGISALIAGKLDLSVTNRPPNPKELAENATLRATEYARTPFVIAVHRDLGVTSLTASALAALYADGPATYPNGKRARPVMRLNDSTDTSLLKSFAPEVASAVDAASARRGMLNANTDSEAADMVEKVPGAFAVSTLAQIESERRPLVALSIDGKVPSAANLMTGHYPYFKSLFLVASAQSGATAQQFAAFVGSPAARKLLSMHGHLPL